MLRHCLLILLVAYHAEAQLKGDETQHVCTEELVYRANATGSVDNEMGTWKISVRSNYSAESMAPLTGVNTSESFGAVADIWLDPFASYDLNDGNNDFSACAFVFKNLPENTRRRGQDDDGSCEQTLSKKCVQQIVQSTQDAAYWLVANPTPGPFSNLTPPILTPICTRISAAIGRYVGDEYRDVQEACEPFFQYDDPADGHFLLDYLVLTDNVTKPVNCTLHTDANNGNTITYRSYNNPAGNSYPVKLSPTESYDRSVTQVWPVLTVMFAPANNTRQSSIGGPYSDMSCLRAANISRTSRTPAALPAARHVKMPGELSKGAIAGIVIGVLLGLALTAGLVWYFWRKRQSKKKAVQKSIETDDRDSANKSEVAHMKDGSNVHEMDQKFPPSQLHADSNLNLTAEMPAREPIGDELSGDRSHPRELMGSLPSEKKVARI